MYDSIYNWIAQNGLEGTVAVYLSWAALAVGVIILATLASFVTKHIFLAAMSLIIKRTKTTWDDALLKRHVLHRAAHIAPALVFYHLAPQFPAVEELIHRLAVVYMLVVGATVASAFLNALLDVYNSLELSRNRPIKGFVQLARIILFVFVTVLVVAVLFKQSPLGLLGGLGALTAVIVLVFRDTILGLVASFQITSNNIVRVGDWIEFAKYGADGDVIDISLLQVRVQNWDKTISTIPTYALISDSFKNWRGMTESGGRRIKRAINIDMNSVRFCDEEMIGRFAKIKFISGYIRKKKEELELYNTELKVDNSVLANGRRMTNLGTFRAYVSAYLKNHPMIRQDMTFLVRHLTPGEHGLPLEIYVFSKDQEWANYESIQADIFDHIIAVVPLFDLRIFQDPSGHDMRTMAATLAPPTHSQPAGSGPAQV